MPIRVPLTGLRKSWKVAIHSEFFLLCVFLHGLHPVDTLQTGHPIHCLIWFVFHSRGNFSALQSNLPSLNKGLKDLGWFSNKNR